MTLRTKTGNKQCQSVLDVVLALAQAELGLLELAAEVVGVLQVAAVVALDADTLALEYLHAHFLGGASTEYPSGEQHLLVAFAAANHLAVVVTGEALVVSAGVGW